MLIPLLASFATPVWLPPEPRALLVQETDPRALYNRAVEHYNARRIEESQALLARIVADHPRAYFAYRLWWDVLGKTSDEAQLAETIERDLAHLADVPLAERDEAYYYSVMEGHERLGLEERAESLRREALTRLPGSKIAQQDLLARADDTEDPVQACALYAEFIETYPDHVSWSQMAARRRFDRIAGARDRFEEGAAVEAARELERWSRAFADTYEQRSRVVIDSLHVAGTLLPFAPEEALAVADRAHAWTLEVAPHTDEFDADAARLLLPFRIVVHQRAGRFEEAARAGDEVFPPDDLPRPFYPSRSTGLHEADLRHAHGVALSALGRHAPAVEQLVYASHLDDVHAPFLAAARDSASAAGVALPSLDDRITAFDRTRRERRRDEVLRSEVRIAAPRFELVDLAGEPVALDDFEGRTLILNFWATW